MANEANFNIIVGMDFSDAGTRAFRQALALAKGRADAAIHLVHAITRADLSTSGSKVERQSDALEQVPREMWIKVDRIMREAEVPHDAIPIWQHVRIGTPKDAILQVAVDYDADLVVVGTRERSGLEKFLLGSVATNLVNEATIPVLVAHDNKLDVSKKTERPAPAPEPGEAPASSGHRPHVYSSTLISAWKSIQRSSIPFT